MSKLVEADFWHKERNGVRCELCARKCFILNGKLGYCEVRKNVNNILYSLNYGKITSFSITNIENNPLFHFYPKSKTFYIFTVGSYLKIDSINKKAKEISSNSLLNEITKSKVKSVTFGPEPIVEMEYVYEIMRANRKNGIANVFVTNGYLTNVVNKKIVKLIDAVTLKVYASLDKNFYKNNLSIENIDPIKIFMRQLKKHRVHLEILNLLFPNVGENLEVFKEFIDFITREIDSYTPLHITQLKPEKQSKLPQISQSILIKFYEEAVNGGMRNVFLHGFANKEDTLCYNCNQVLIKRENGVVKKYILEDGRCPSCGLKMNVINK